MLGVVPQSHVLAEGPVTQSGKLQGVGSLGQAGGGELQTVGAHRDLGGMTAQVRSGILMQGKGPQQGLSLIKLGLDLTVLKLGRRLFVVQPEGQGDASGRGSGGFRRRPRGQQRAEHTNAQQRGEETVKTFHGHCPFFLR